MNDDRRGPSGQTPAVGSVGEEAVRLLGALSGWAREHPDSGPGEPDPAAETDPATAGGPAAHGLADALGEVVRNLGDHLATGGEDCRLCPVCQVIHVVRDTNPEVSRQLRVAANALLKAGAGLLATQAPRSEPSGVQRIDLSGDADWGDER